jgi:hypothetical protein
MLKFSKPLALLQVGGSPSVSSINKIDRHDITEILLKVALKTITHGNHY